MIYSAAHLTSRCRTTSPRLRPWIPALLFVLALGLVGHTAAQSLDGGHAVVSSERPVLWADPGDIKSLDLFYGPGGKKHLPQLPVKFVEEIREGGSPKFDVVDAAGKKWRAKLGDEAQPETVAARLLWAAGYVANVNYYFQDLVVEGLPEHLHRGQEFVRPGGHVSNVRLQRHPESEGKSTKKAGSWNWRHNPFTGTRQFDGLRVMMALISNWDLVNNNTALRDDGHGEQLYQVSDVGSSFGMSGKSYTDALSKNNLEKYRKSRFIAKATPEYVDLNFPTHPPILYVFDLKMFWQLTRPRWIGRHIPRDHVKWIASQLAQLSAQQIRDAFRAAGYSPNDVEGFSTAVEARIAALSQL